MLGWGMEALFRRVYSGEWINPGFLVGPCLPLYGFGLCLLYLLSELDMLISFGNSVVSRLLLILVMALAMTILEYIAGIIFIKGMKTQLWDYSNEKWNIQGIVCPKYSLLWALLCAVYYFFLHPLVSSLLFWFGNHIEWSFFLGIFYGIFAVDLTYSLQLVAKIKHFAEENNILVLYEELKANIRRTAAEQKEKYRYLFAFSSRVPLYEHLKKYFALIQAFAAEKIDGKPEEEEPGTEEEQKNPDKLYGAAASSDD